MSSINDPLLPAPSAAAGSDIQGPEVGGKHHGQHHPAPQVKPHPAPNHPDPQAYSQHLEMTPAELKQLHKKNRKACEELQKRLQDTPSDVTIQELNATFQRLLLYKNRWLDAPILHYVVHHDDDSLVKLVLDNKANVKSTATYEMVPEFGEAKASAKIHLEAIHVAAGAGCKNALAALLTGGADLDVYCQMKMRDTSYSHPFYTPLHEAAWCGRKETMEMLLKAGANPLLVNKDGKTALHMLVQGGSSGNPDTKDMINILMTNDPSKKDALLKARTNKGIKPAEFADLTPLQLAFVGGQFPQELMHFLVSSTSAVEGMLSLSRVSMSATTAFADQLDQRDRFEVLLGAQEPGVVDKLATLLFTAPKAADRMLKAFLVEPTIADAHYWPVPNSAVMKRDFGLTQLELVCQYQTDVKMKSYRARESDHRGQAFPLDSIDDIGDRKLLWPSWNFDSIHFRKADWHKDLVRPPEDYEPGEGVADVQVKVVMVPDILDIDILWALARVPPKNCEIFARLAVKGIVCCVWRGLIERAYLLNLLWRSLEQVALVYWGCSASAYKSDEESESEYNFLLLPLCWSLLLAAALRELVELVVWCLSYNRKRCQYREERHSWSEDSNACGDLLDKSLLGDHALAQWRSLWSAWYFWLRTDFIFQGLLAFLLFYVLVFHSGLQSWGLSFGPEQARAAQVPLALNLALRFLSYTAMLRVSTPFGKKVVTMMNSLLSFSMLQMFMTMGFVFLAIWCTFVAAVGGRHPRYWVAIYLFRALIVGDGDGLEKLGLGPDDEQGTDDGAIGRETDYHHTVMCWMMVCASGLFQLVVLNLIVNPVTGNEYDTIQQEADLVIERERAGYSVMYLLTKRPKKATYAQMESLCEGCFGDHVTLNQVLCGAAALLLAHGTLGPLCYRHVFTVVESAVSLALGQALLSVALLRCDWIGDIANSGEKEQPQEGPQHQQGPRFLWICHRKDYNEQWSTANDPIEKGDLEKIAVDMGKELRNLREQVSALAKKE